MIGASFDSVKTGKSIAREPELVRAGVVTEAYDGGPEEEWDAEEPPEEASL